MHPSHHARTRPEKPALIMQPSGKVTTYAQLEEGSNKAAHLLRSLGLKRGDVAAVFLENHPKFLEIAWGAQRSGLFLVCISSRFGPSEVSYLLSDSNAQVLITSAELAPVAQEVAKSAPELHLLMLDDVRPGFRSYEDAVEELPGTPIPDESHGSDLLYSSGTTGRPKGVRTPLPDGPLDTPPPIAGLAREYYGFDENTVYLCPAPLYHAAPLRWSMLVQRLGGTVVLLSNFDAELALASIEKYQVTAAQWVPTHFVRMLKLPDEVRARYDHSSLRTAVHAAAPCPVEVKKAMIDWWGPILFEYYAGTEANGLTGLSTEEWLRKPGSVGRSIVGEVKICDDLGEPVPIGTEGLVYFANGLPFEYHNDPQKTAESRNRYGWTSLGDIGRLDEDGYLYLTDRKSFTIISGGVNIYPREIEDILVTHPRVADAAVIGAPDPDMGERVVAVIQPLSWSDAGPALAEELQQFVRQRLSGIKVPRQVDFMAELPRHPNGKMYKRQIRELYWSSGS
ncbi:acyl-CoA synthetase [Sphingomonas agri]|uniref:acyl-CoA synthetase n=1 Tax=Sphingomonas agri TaxID=1813878 RepID=UPI00311D3897